MRHPSSHAQGSGFASPMGGVPWGQERSDWGANSFHFGCAQTRASRRMWCLAARDLAHLIDRSRTSRTANTMSRGNGVHGHTRSGADDESRTRGLDHGVVALCLLSYSRKKVQDKPSASTEIVLRQLVKERPPAVRSIDRGLAPMRRPVVVRNEKGPDPFGIRASANRAWRVR